MKMHMLDGRIVPLRRAAALAWIVVLVGLPAAVLADQPTYASAPQTETIKGTIFQITGKYTLTVQDDRGFNDSVTLHDGTVIRPTGLSLGSGQVATIVGRTDGKTFAADEVDVDPATIGYGQAVLPGGNYPTLYGEGYNGYGGYGYPAYAFGYTGGYGPGGFVGAYAPGFYGGYYPGYYPGYSNGYYNGGYYVNPPQTTTPTQNVPEPIGRRPVNVPPAGYPPGVRYPTGGVRAPEPGGAGGSRYGAPSVRIAPPTYRTVAPITRMAPPAVRAAPPVHAPPPQAAAQNHNR